MGKKDNLPWLRKHYIAMIKKSLSLKTNHGHLFGANIIKKLTKLRKVTCIMQITSVLRPLFVYYYLSSYPNKENCAFLYYYLYFQLLLFDE